MKKITIIAVTLLTALLFNSCGNKVLTFEEMNSLAVEYNEGNGPIAGINIGDDWNEIKKNYAKDWEVSEDGNNGLINKEWDSYNFIYITLTLDEAKKVTQMIMNFESSIENVKNLILIDRALDDKFSTNYKPSGEQSWEIEASEGYSIYKMYMDKLGKNETNSSLSIRVESY